MKSKYLKKINYILIFIGLIILFILLLTLTSIFPSKKIFENVRESAITFSNEGNRKEIQVPYKINITEFELDNFTDALMLNTAYSIDSATPLYSSLIARKNYIPNVTTCVYEDEVGELRSASKYEGHNEVGELMDLINGEEIESFEYARYWHGYLIILRPLLLIFNITNIRIILTILLITLAIILLFLLYKKTNITISIIFLLGLMSADFIFLGFSMHSIICFLIAIITSIILILRFDKIKDFGLVFFITGILVNFFDLLNVPLITLLMPLIIYILLKEEKSISLKTIILDIIKYCLLWGIGYSMTWFAKWLLVDLLFDKNVIETAIKQVIYRSVETPEYKLYEVIVWNIKHMGSNFLVSIIITYILVIFKGIVSRKKQGTNIESTIKASLLVGQLLPYIIIGIIPIVWYTVLQNHSYEHSFFTYRILMITIICINLCTEKIYKIYCNNDYNKKGLEN